MFRSHTRLGGLCVALVLLASAGAHAQTGRYLVKLRDPQGGRAAVEAAGGSIVLDLAPQQAVAATIPAAAIDGLRHNPRIEFIEDDPQRFLFAQTVPYGISMVQAPQVWSESAVASRTVCVIDSGFGLGHEDLPQAVTGYPSDWNQDGCGHGTHVSGTIAALDNTVGVVGVAPSGISLHMVRVFGDDCRWAYASTLIDAVNRCRSAGANVISMSLGGRFGSSLESSAFSQAWNAGVLSVAAAGNSGNGQLSYPASYASVISVAAVDSSEKVAWFSQHNAAVDLAAPGVSVLSTVPWTASGLPGSGYESWSGTSMATPHVSAAAALVWARNPAWTNAQIRKALEDSAKDLGATGRDDYYGFGLVQAKAALDALLGTTPPPPPTGFALSASGYKVKSQKRVDLAWSGTTAAQVEVFRDGTLVATTPNDGAYTDTLPSKGGGTFRYRVCEAPGGTVCSNDASVTF